MLPVQLVRHFEAVFKSLDQHSDLIIQRIPFINNLATDPVVKQYLNLPAVYEPDLGKQISLRRIFERI